MATPVKSNAINEDALTPYARRLPQPMHKNKSKQTEAVAAYPLLKQVIAALQSDPGNVLPCWNTICEREKTLSKETLAGDGEFMEGGTLKGMPMDFKTRIVSDISDLTVDQALALERKKPGAVDLLLFSAVQVSLNAKLPEVSRLGHPLFPAEEPQRLLR